MSSKPQIAAPQRVSSSATRGQPSSDTQRQTTATPNKHTTSASLPLHNSAKSADAVASQKSPQSNPTTGQTPRKGAVPGPETAGLSNTQTSAVPPQAGQVGPRGKEQSGTSEPGGQDTPNAAPPAQQSTDPVDVARQERGGAELAAGKGQNGVAPAHGYEVAYSLRDGLQKQGGDSVWKVAAESGADPHEAVAANAQVKNFRNMQPGDIAFVPLAAPSGISDGRTAAADGSTPDTIGAINNAIAAKGTANADGARTAAVNSIVGDLNRQADGSKGLSVQQLRDQATRTINGDAQTYGLNDWTVGASNSDIVSSDASSVSETALKQFTDAHPDAGANPAAPDNSTSSTSATPNAPLSAPGNMQTPQQPATPVTTNDQQVVDATAYYASNYANLMRSNARNDPDAAKLSYQQSSENSRLGLVKIRGDQQAAAVPANQPGSDAKGAQWNNDLNARLRSNPSIQQEWTKYSSDANLSPEAKQAIQGILSGNTDSTAALPAASQPTGQGTQAAQQSQSQPEGQSGQLDQATLAEMAADPSSSGKGGPGAAPAGASFVPGANHDAVNSAMADISGKGAPPRASGALDIATDAATTAAEVNTQFDKLNGSDAEELGLRMTDVTGRLGPVSPNQSNPQQSALDNITAAMGYGAGNENEGGGIYRGETREQVNNSWVSLANAAAKDHSFSEAAGVSLANATPITENDRSYLSKGGFAQSQSSVSSGNTALRDSYVKALRTLGDNAISTRQSNPEAAIEKQRLHDDYYSAADVAAGS